MEILAVNNARNMRKLINQGGDMTTVNKTSKPKLLAKELKTWLNGRKGWNHNEWLALLADLRTKGYSKITDSQEGCGSIGMFLEANRGKEFDTYVAI